MANMYKEHKEAFVTGHLGGTLTEINLVTLVAPASVLLWSVLQSNVSFFTPYTLIAGIVDFLLNCSAILFATTLYASSPAILNLLLILPTLAVLVSSNLPTQHKVSSRAETQRRSNTKEGSQEPLPVKSFVTTYRGTMMVITCVAILAVDFRVFPRRFAKVENWGTSLMDLGVGSFVFSGGTVSARPILKEQLAGRSPSLSSRMSAALRRCIPLLVLGFIRLYSVKELEYAEHVSEYGIHWNFFFTMAFIPPVVALFDAAFRLLPSYATLALVIGVMYELLLDNTDLKAYILAAPRTDLLSKNREGIFSFIGYLAIFLAGQAIGMNILPKEAPGMPLRKSVLGKLIVWSALWIVLFLFTTSYAFGLNLQVSRRLANLPYFLWVAAFNCIQLTLYHIIEKIVFSERVRQKRKTREEVSRLLQAFNRNGLAIFLLANMLTGLVNLTLPTLTMSDFQAMTVLLVYCGILSVVALGLYSRNISIKL